MSIVLKESLAPRPWLTKSSERSRWDQAGEELEAAQRLLFRLGEEKREMMERFEDLCKKGGLGDEIHLNQPWLLPKLQAFLQRWAETEEQLGELTTQLSHSLHWGQLDADLVSAGRALLGEIERLKEDECELVYESFRDLGAPD